MEVKKINITETRLTRHNVCTCTTHFVSKNGDVEIMVNKNMRIKDNYRTRWVKYGHPEIVKFLINRGADIHAENDYAVRYASYRGYLDVVKYLVENKANIHAKDDYAVRFASGGRHLEVVKFLVDKGANIHAKDDYALRCASICGYLDIVEFLVSNGADIHADNDYAVRCASEYGHLDTAKYLVDKGANIHAEDDCAVQYASLGGHLEVVKFLIIKGANISKINNKNIISLSEDKKFISNIVNEGCCLDMTKDNLIVEKVKALLISKIDLILKKYIILIPNIRNQLIYIY